MIYPILNLWARVKAFLIRFKPIVITLQKEEDFFGIKELSPFEGKMIWLSKWTYILEGPPTKNDTRRYLIYYDDFIIMRTYTKQKYVEEAVKRLHRGKTSPYSIKVNAHQEWTLRFIQKFKKDLFIKYIRDNLDEHRKILVITRGDIDAGVPLILLFYQEKEINKMILWSNFLNTY